MKQDRAAYDPEADKDRRRKQLGRVYSVLRDGLWRSFAQIQDAIGRGSEASISARLRDLRKTKWGSWTVDRKYVGDGLWIYRVWK